MPKWFGLIGVLRPGKQFFSHVETEPLLPGIKGTLMPKWFGLIGVLRPGKQFFSHVETEPLLPGYY